MTQTESTLHRCGYCQRYNATTMDHIIPRRQFGESTPDNLVWACRACNSAKGGKTPEQALMKIHWHVDCVVSDEDAESKKWAANPYAPKHSDLESFIRELQEASRRLVLGYLETVPEWQKLSLSDQEKILVKVRRVGLYEKRVGASFNDQLDVIT